MAMALERNTMFQNNLVLPTVYQKIEVDEMEYVDGGIGFSSQWWGVQLTFNGNETTGLLYAIAAGSAVAWLGAELVASGIVTLPAAIPLGVLAAALAVSAGAIGLVNWKNGGNGFSINRFWAGLITIW